MKLDRQKYDLAKARACKGQKELMAEVLDIRRRKR